MIKKPVKYKEDERILLDGNFNTFAVPFQRMGMPIEEVHKVGHEIEQALNNTIDLETPDAVKSGVSKVVGTVKNVIDGTVKAVKDDIDKAGKDIKKVIKKGK